MIFSLGQSQPGAGPTAPPARNTWDVFSVFSDVYTPVAGTRNYNPGWGQVGSASVIAVGGDNVWRATNLNYQGLDFGGNINVSAMTTFHVDVYTTDETSLQFFQINNGGGERSYTLTPLNQNSWNSYDIPLTAWTSQSGFAVNALFQFKIVGSGGKTVYLDNMYFYRSATTQPPTYGAFTVPSQLAGASPFSLTAPTSNNTSPFTYASSNTSVATISGSTVTIVGVGTSTITASQVADGTYSAGSTTATLTVTPPAAPTPIARNSWDVVSFYSNAYTNSSTPTWGGSASSDISIGGNTTRSLTSLTSAQIAFASTNVSAMTHLHIDVYSLNQANLWFWLMSQRVDLPTPINGWTSIDIPLSTYAGLGINLSTINLFRIENPTGAALPAKNAYVDNIYFYRAATDAPPTLGALTVPSPKVLGDAPFTLTNPTSNSSGAWTYSSSPAGVVTFSGNTATIVGGGTTTITATQAAVPGSFGVGTASASLVVTYPDPGASPALAARTAGTVVPMYTGGSTDPVYANTFTVEQASWSTGSTQSLFTFANGTDNCLRVNNLGFFGLVRTAGANFSVTGMTKLHVDIYLNSSITNMFVTLVSTAADQLYNTGALTAGWNSLDINLTSFPNAALATVYGLKFEQNVGSARQIYLDNVYFYFAPTTPTISNFSSVAKVMGAAPFTLNATSTSPATITYTSSNPAVATIIGNTVTVVGIGTSTLTASQVATGTFAAGSATATLTVTGSTTPLAGPTAPPARNAWDVLSIFSDTYTPVAGTRTYNPGWGQAGSASVVSVAGDNAWKAINLNYQGLDFGANVNVSAMTTMHVDVWTFDETSLQFFQINNGGGERSYTLTPLVQGQWNSYDIPITAWTSQSGFAVNALFQFKIVGSGGKTVYLDNMYFYRPATTLPPTLGAFTVPSKLVGDAPFTLTAPTSNSAGAFTYTSSNTAVATISGDTVTVVGAGTSTITATQAADGTFGSGSTTATLSVTPPAAPTPPARNTWDRISFYSDTYANQSAPTWGGQTADVSIAGNTTRLFTNYLFGQIAFAATDVSAMTWLHIDVFSLDQTPLWFWLGNQRVILPTPINGWTSLDIPLSSYSALGVNLAAVNIFKIENPNGAGGSRNAYVDNIYFYRNATLPPATVGSFTVPAKVLGDAPFTLTPPTSTNTSPFTYSSSNTSVATISGDTVTVVGGGTSTITASQVADGTFGPTSTTASLVVTYPVPGASPVPPVRDPSKVMSMYTGTPSVYANNPLYTTVRASWTGATTANFNFANGTNTCIQVNNLGFIGLVDQTERRVSVTTMTNLHLDVYVNSPLSNLFVFLLDGADHNYSTGPLVTGWNSLSIPLTAYAGTNLASIYGLKLEQNVAPSTTQIYLDNIYFSNDRYYADADGDGYGDANVSVLAATQPAGYVLNSTDCDDTNIAIYRTGDFYVDSDNDGFNNGGPLTTTCYGASAPTGFTANNIGTDCDDNDAEINPNHVEVLDNGLDDNCDGNIDEVAPTSSLQPSQCGSTLTNISQAIYANVVTGAVAAQGYRFEVTEVSNPSNVRTYDSATNNFNLNNLSGGGAINTTYSIRVAVKTAPGFWRAYASACNVTTPAVAATTKVSFPACGSTLTNIASTIYCDAVPGATGYRFRVTDGVTTTTFDASVNRFSLTNVNANFGTTYTIDVQLRFGTTWETTWGAVCSYTTPATPGTSNVSAAQCGINITNLWSTIYATQVSAATGYRFEVTKSGGATVFYDTPNARFSLRNITVPGFTVTNSSYSIRVAILYNSIYQAFGSACTITTTGASRITKTPLDVFEVNAYPNPFANNFKLEVNTSSEENVSVKVYDMLGRAIEMKQGSLSDMTSSEMGDQLTSGVYNVIVTQGENVKTLRMIKR